MSTIIFLIIGISLVIYTILQYNKLLDKRNKLKSSWDEIDLQLKRRYELTINLINSVKEYMIPEDIERILKPINFLVVGTPQTRIEANEEVEEILKSTFSLSDTPKRNNDKNITYVQNQLMDAQEKITNVHKSFNNTVIEYNNHRNSIPTKWIANILGFPLEEEITVQKNEHTSGM